MLVLLIEYEWIEKSFGYIKEDLLYPRSQHGSIHPNIYLLYKF